MRKCFYLCVHFLQWEIGIEFCRQIKTLEQGKTLNPPTKLKYAMNWKVYPRNKCQIKAEEMREIMNANLFHLYGNVDQIQN